MGVISELKNTKVALSRVESADFLMEVTEEMRTALQKEILDIYKDIAAVCKKHDIRVALVGGSALGAVRHGGFIPWDDDLDITMPRADYEKFKEIFEAEMGDRYVLSAPNYTTKSKKRFPKVLKKGTILEELVDVSDPNLQGIFVDIFVMDNVPLNMLHRKIKGNYVNLLELISGAVEFRENADEKAREFYKMAGPKAYKMRNFIGAFFSYRSAASWFNKVDKAAQYKKETGLVTFATGRKHYFGEILDGSQLLPLGTGTFEGETVGLFKDIDLYLKNLYGDYMWIPPVEKREKHFIRRFELPKKEESK